MTETLPPDSPDDMVSVSLAERLADERARRAADRARLPAFFFGVMFTVAMAGLFLRGAGGGEDSGLADDGLDVADAALALFAALAVAVGVLGEERVKFWLGRLLGSGPGDREAR